MKYLIISFFVSLLAGQLGSIPAFGGYIYLHDITISLIIFCYFFIRKPVISQMKNYSITLPLISLFSVIIFSIVINWGRYEFDQNINGFLYAARFIIYSLLYFPVRSAFGKVKGADWIFGIFTVSVIFSLFGLIQYYFFPSLKLLVSSGWDPHNYRLVSIFFDPNFAGIVILVGFLAGFRIFGNISLPLFIFFQIINILAIILTYSRSTYLALLGAVFALIFIERKLILILVVPVAFAGLLLFPRKNLDTSDIFRTETSISRINNWINSFETAKSAPIFGQGFGTVRYLHKGRSISDRPDKAGAGIDNSLLYIASATGITGLIIFVWLWWGYFRIGFSNGKNKVNIGWYLAALVAVSIHSQFNNSLFYPWVVIFVSVLSGALEESKNSA